MTITAVKCTVKTNRESKQTHLLVLTDRQQVNGIVKCKKFMLYRFQKLWSEPNNMQKMASQTKTSH